jgi:hypothetical protein
MAVAEPRAPVQRGAEWADARVGICDRGLLSDGNDSPERGE